MNLADINLELARFQGLFLKTYMGIKDQLKGDVPKELMKSCFFWHLLRKNFHTYEKFQRTEDWIDFCEEINEMEENKIFQIVSKN